MTNIHYLGWIVLDWAKNYCIVHCCMCVCDIYLVIVVVCVWLLQKPKFIKKSLIKY